MFGPDSPGKLIAITGSDPMLGGWEHRAFVPAPLPDSMPPIEPETILAIANARAALAALDNTARRLPNPMLLRLPTLRLEAQSTSALRGRTLHWPKCSSPMTMSPRQRNWSRFSTMCMD